MNPRLSKGIIALAAAVSAFARAFFDLDDATAHTLDVVITGLVMWLIKTPGDLRMRPLIQQDAP